MCAGVPVDHLDEEAIAGAARCLLEGASRDPAAMILFGEACRVPVLRVPLSHAVPPEEWDAVLKELWRSNPYAFTGLARGISRLGAGRCRGDLCELGQWICEWVADMGGLEAAAQGGDEARPAWEAAGAGLGLVGRWLAVYPEEYAPWLEDAAEMLEGWVPDDPVSDPVVRGLLRCLKARPLPSWPASERWRAVCATGHRTGLRWRAVRVSSARGRCPRRWARS
jgi:hypothetical protein